MIAIDIARLTGCSTAGTMTVYTVAIDIIETVITIVSQFQRVQSLKKGHALMVELPHP